MGFRNKEKLLWGGTGTATINAWMRIGCSPSRPTSCTCERHAKLQGFRANFVRHVISIVLLMGIVTTVAIMTT